MNVAAVQTVRSSLIVLRQRHTVEDPLRPLNLPQTDCLLTNGCLLSNAPARWLIRHRSFTMYDRLPS